MSTVIAVLVSYGDSKRVLKISKSPGMSPLLLLKEEFQNVFLEGNHNVNVIFQKFDCDWEEYVDLSASDDIANKDKVKAIITENNKTADETPILSKRKLDFQDSPELEFDATDSTDNLDHINHIGSDVEVKTKRKKVFKKEEDMIPLPDPFPLPKHYKADVEIALKQRKMSWTTRCQFISDIASTMLGYKQYPSNEDYENVARTVVSRYPFLRAPPRAGTPHGTVSDDLKSRFKEFRRASKPSPSKTPKASIRDSKVLRKHPGITHSTEAPKVPEGEDEFSFKQHQKTLQAEYFKRHPNMDLVHRLMELSYPMRRIDITDKGYTGVYALFEEYPFLQNYDHLTSEMCRIIQKNLSYIEEATKKWEATCNDIVLQAHVEAQHSTKINFLLSSGSQVADTLLALVLLPYIIPDPTTKIDHTTIIRTVQKINDIQEETEKIKVNTPYLLVGGSMEKPDSVYLIADRACICEISCINNASFALLSAYFVYYIQYPRGFNNVFAFLEVTLLDFPAVKTSTSVKRLLTSLDQHKEE